MREKVKSEQGEAKNLVDDSLKNEGQPLTEQAKKTGRILSSADGSDQFSAEYSTETDSPKEEIERSNLNDVKSLEARLRAEIDKLDDDEIKDSLHTQLQKESDIIKNATTNALDKNKQETLPDGSKSLSELQAKTKNIFEQKLSDVANKKEATRIGELLDALHKERLNLLVKSVFNKNQSRMDDAYELLMAKLDTKPIILPKEPGQPVKNRFLEHINSISEKSIKNESTGAQVHYAGGSITSNDPEILGLSLAAAGFKTATFTKGSPLELLSAAEAALKYGVLSVEFTKPITRVIHNPNSYKSQYEFNAAVERYNKIMQRAATKKLVSDASPNNIFNKFSYIDEKVNEFNLLPTHKDREGLVKSLRPRDREALAQAVKGFQYSNDKDKRLINGENYVQSLSRKFQNQVERNYEKKEQKYAAEAAKNRAEAERAELVAKDPKDIAEHIIGDSRHERRMAYIQDLQNYNPQGGDPEDPNNKLFQNQVKAHIINDYFDRLAANLTIPSQSKVEFNQLLEGTNSTDRDEIWREWSQSNRLAAKFDNWNRAHPDDDRIVDLEDIARVDFDEFLETSEAPCEGTLLDKQDNLAKYIETIEKMNERFKALNKKQLEETGDLVISDDIGGPGV